MRQLNGLHFVVSHSGAPDIDPDKHRLVRALPRASSPSTTSAATCEQHIKEGKNAIK